MTEIINAQGRRKLPGISTYTHPVRAHKIGRVKEINNEVIAKIARIAGAPEDKGAGLRLARKVHEPVNRGDLLYTVYAQSKFNLKLVQEFLRQDNGYTIH